MPTTSTKGKPVLAGTDAFAPHTHINNAVNWAETFANVRSVADSTAMNALQGNDVWVGLQVFHTGGTYSGSVWVCTATAGSPATGTWKRADVYALPDPQVTRAATNNNNITATAWGTAVPNGQGTVSLVLSSAAWVDISYNCWLTMSGAGSIRAGVGASGATTIVPATIGGYPEFGSAMYIESAGTVAQSSSYTIKCNAGTTVFSMQAYKTSTPTTAYVNYSSMVITPLRWAN